VNNKVEKLNKDIRTLLERIRVDWLDIGMSRRLLK